MINLYKVNGQLKARGKLLADYTEVIVAKSKEQWLKDMKAEYELAYPKYTTEIVIDKLTKEEITNQVEIVYEHTFDSWLLETEIVEPAVEEVRNEYGMVEVPYKTEVTKLLREFTAPIATEDMLDEYLKTRYAELRAVKYLPIGEQLDMLYKDMVDGGTRFKDHIASVKESISK